MGKNYTPSVSLMDSGALSFNQTTPDKRGKLRLGKLVKAEVGRLREGAINQIAKQFDKVLDKINAERRIHGLDPIVDIIKVDSYQAIEALEMLNMPSDPQERKDLLNYYNILFPVGDSKHEADLRDREFAEFDNAWSYYHWKVRRDRSPEDWADIEKKQVEKRKEDIRRWREEVGWKNEENDSVLNEFFDEFNNKDV